MVSDPYSPGKLDESRIQIEGFQVSLYAVGCIHSSDEIIEAWHKLENRGFPLRGISELFVKMERLENAKTGEHYFIPYVKHLVKLVDLIIYCEQIEGGRTRIESIIEKLSKHIASAVDGKHKQSDLIDRIFEDVVQSEDELELAFLLHKLDSTLQFNNEKKGGPDFKVGHIGIKIEAKSKLNRSFIGSSGMPHFAIDTNICKRLLSRDAFKAGVLQKAFDDQQTDVAMINLSHSEFGDLFAGYAYGEGVDKFDLQKSVKAAQEMVKLKQKAVILYVEAISASGKHSLVGLACDRESVESKGAYLEKREKERGIESLNGEKRYNEIIAEAKELEYPSK